MKLYDYRCQTCEKVEEHYVKQTEDKVHCNECGTQMERLISAPPFHLKGKGWFRDGYSGGNR